MSDCYVVRYLEDEGKVGDMFTHELWEGDKLLLKTTLPSVTAVLHGRYVAKPLDVFEVRGDVSQQLYHSIMLYRIIHMDEEETAVAAQAAEMDIMNFKQHQDKLRLQSHPE